VARGRGNQDPVAFTHGSLEPLAVPDDEGAAVRPNRSARVQLGDGVADTRFADAQHAGEPGLRHVDRIGPEAIGGGQEPATQALEHGMHAIAEPEMHDFVKDAAVVLQDEVVQGLVLVKRCPEIRGA
jgi:hypothetical protein